MAYPFRPFFLLAGLYGALGMLGWLNWLFAEAPLLATASPLQWHAHEMLFGWVSAAIAGFLLTAICNWTGAPPLRGWRLGLLVSLWLAGRAAMWSPQWLPPIWMAAIDLAFLPVLAGYVARVLIRAGNRRNLPIVAVLGLLATANVITHLAFSGVTPGLAGVGEGMAVNLIIVLMVVIGGRIIPLFTANWLAHRGGPADRVRSRPMVDRLTLAATALMIPADWLTTTPWPGAILALIAAAANSWRLAGWRGWLGRSEPLLWVLHLGYLWIVAALWFKGLTPWLDGAGKALWLHAAGAGAMGTLILGVMSRVALGHTGRALRLPRGASAIYYGVTVAALLRIGAALGWGEYRALLTGSGVAWVVAMLLFVLYYWPILSRPRVDGRPG
nr:NnrS family protein [Parahaliea mediterranea]